MPCHSAIEAALAAIRDDRERGAAELALAALDALALAAREADAASGARLRGRLIEVGRALVLARPSMAPLVNAVAAVFARLPDGAELSANVATMAVQAARTELTTAADAAIATAVARLGGVERVVTLSYSSAVAAALERAEVGEVIVGEGRPGLEGRRLAGRLAEAGRRVTLVTDAQLGRFVERAARGLDGAEPPRAPPSAGEESGAPTPTGNHLHLVPALAAEGVRAGSQSAGEHMRASRTVVLVGADSLLPDGSVVNKAGTRLLAALAASEGVPVWVVADTSKLAAWWRLGDPVRLEAMAPAEVWDAPPPGVAVENVYFDRTPTRFVSAYLTEHGAFGTANLAAHAAGRRQRHLQVYAWLG